MSSRQPGAGLSVDEAGRPSDAAMTSVANRLRAASRISASSWVAEDVLDEAQRGVLSSEFPCAGFGWHRRTEGDRTYRYWSRRLVAEGERVAWEPRTLSQEWQDIVSLVVSDELSSAVASVTGTDLGATSVAAHLFRYEPGCFFTAHQGSEARLGKVLFFVNDVWDPSWGGQMRMLGADGAVIGDVEPRPGSAEIVRRAEDAWRSIEPVAAGAPCSLQLFEVAFYRR